MKKLLRSPWLAHHEQPSIHECLQTSLSTDVVIVGGGIAGISTAYFALRDTQKQVVLLEATQLAHGATGHNAGQLVSYFERPFHEMVDEFGVEMATAGQHDVYSAWELLAQIQQDLHLKTPCLTFTGYAGIADAQTLLSHLEDAWLKREAGVDTEQIYVAQQVGQKLKIAKKYQAIYLTIPHQEILDRLETGDRRYFAVIAGRKGCMNSAEFTLEVAQALLTKYPKRFRIFEHAFVQKIALHKSHAVVQVGKLQVRSKRVILCTNGFENFKLENRAGGEIDTKFHHLVRGSVGYMAAFVERPLEYPTAISYLPEPSPHSGTHDTEPYFYLTRRPYAHAGSQTHEDLVCVGGPERLFDDTRKYSLDHQYPENAHKQLLAFLKKTYRHVGKKLTFKYYWHGLMGYTPNGIRCVGAEPCNPVLLYNLGCNGVGILPSIYGGSRIARILRGDKLATSIFDPQDQRCLRSAKSEQQLISHRFLISSVVLMVFLVSVRVALSLGF